MMLSGSFKWFLTNSWLLRCVLSKREPFLQMLWKVLSFAEFLCFKSLLLLNTIAMNKSFYVFRGTIREYGLESMKIQQSRDIVFCLHVCKYCTRQPAQLRNQHGKPADSKCKQQSARMYAEGKLFYAPNTFSAYQIMKR